MNICLRISLNVHGHCVHITVGAMYRGEVRAERWSRCIVIISLSTNFRNILQGQHPPVTFLWEKLVQSVEFSYLYHCCWYSSQSSKEGSWWIFGNSRAERGGKALGKKEIVKYRNSCGCNSHTLLLRQCEFLILSLKPSSVCQGQCISQSKK